MERHTGKEVKIESVDIAILCARTAEDKKGLDIKVLDVEQIIRITDFFVLISCTGARHVEALGEALRKILKENDIDLSRVEGTGQGWWRLIDAGDVVIHLFEEKARIYYDIDNLLGDARLLDWQNSDPGTGESHDV